MYTASWGHLAFWLDDEERYGQVLELPLMAKEMGGNLSQYLFITMFSTRYSDSE